MHVDHDGLLIPFESGHAPLVASWATSAQEATWWAGVGFPVAFSAVLDWQRDPDTRGFVLISSSEPVAYGEIWDDGEESESELAHLIVAPTRRGQGLARKLVRSLIPLAGFGTLFVRVHPDNQAARKSYLGAGLTLVDEERAAEWNAAQPVDYVWLER